MSETMIYAQASARDLLEAIPAYEAVECDLTAITVAFIRQHRYDASLATFQVRGRPFPAVNFSSVHLILTPLVREEDGRRTLAPVAAWISANGVTDIRIVGSGPWSRQHQYSRNGGRSWGRMAVTGSAPPQPAPVQVIEPAIPPAPTEEEVHA